MSSCRFFATLAIFALLTLLMGGAVVVILIPHPRLRTQ
jgi:hypothetical protein